MTLLLSSLLFFYNPYVVRLVSPSVSRSWTTIGFGAAFCRTLPTSVFDKQKKPFYLPPNLIFSFSGNALASISWVPNPLPHRDNLLFLLVHPAIQTLCNPSKQ